MVPLLASIILLTGWRPRPTFVLPRISLNSSTCSSHEDYPQTQNMYHVTYARDLRVDFFFAVFFLDRFFAGFFLGFSSGFSSSASSSFFPKIHSSMPNSSPPSFGSSRPIEKSCFRQALLKLMKALETFLANSSSRVLKNPRRFIQMSRNEACTL